MFPEIDKVELPYTPELTLNELLILVKPVIVVLPPTLNVFLFNISNNSGILLKDGGMRINIKKIKKINK